MSRIGVPCFRITFPTRMTIVRTAGRKLFIHSPTRLTASLEAEVAQVGTPRWLIGPNRFTPGGVRTGQRLIPTH